MYREVITERGYDGKCCRQCNEAVAEVPFTACSWTRR